MKRMAKSKGKGFAKTTSLLSLLVLVVALAVGVVSLQKTRNLTSPQASSGCVIVATDQGPGCWCSSGGWQFHCGVPKGQPTPDQCISDCQDRNTDATGDRSSPQADKCDQGKLGGACSGQYRYSCGSDGCKAQCNNYPKSGHWVLTGEKNCGKPGDLKPTPTHRPNQPTPTPTRRTSRPTPTPTPVGKLSTPVISCRFVKVNQDVVVEFDWNDVSGAGKYLVMIQVTTGHELRELDSRTVTESEYRIDTIPGRATYTSTVQALGANFNHHSDDGVTSCRYTGG